MGSGERAHEYPARLPDVRTERDRLSLPGQASAENARIADWLVRLTTAYRDWGSDCAFCTCATSRATAGITNGSTASTGAGIEPTHQA